MTWSLPDSPDSGVIPVDRDTRVPALGSSIYNMTDSKLSPRRSLLSPVEATHVYEEDRLKVDPAGGGGLHGLQQETDNVMATVVKVENQNSYYELHDSWTTLSGKPWMLMITVITNLFTFLNSCDS